MALPVMLAAPVLFVIGVVFTYFIVLPAAVDFLQGYNSTYFNTSSRPSPCTRSRC